MQNELKILDDIAKKYLISEPRIVGGIPRDYALNGYGSISFKDIDITTNSDEVLRLAVLFAKRMGVGHKIFADGHASVFLGNGIFDFSSRFISDSAVKYCRNDLKIFDESLYESFSRDFTINSLEVDLYLNKILDPTSLGLNDVELKVIRPITTASICISDDPRRAFRAIKLASKYGLEIDEGIYNFVRSNKDIFKPSNGRVKSSYISEIINSSIEFDADKTFDNILKMKLLFSVPLTGKFKDWLIDNKMLDFYFKSLDLE